MSNMKYVLFLNDTEDDYYFGCTATSRAIKDHIRSDCPNFKIVPSVPTTKERLRLCERSILRLRITVIGR